MKITRWILLVVLAVMLTGCSTIYVNKISVPTPESGNCNVVGLLVSIEEGNPVPNTIVRLAEVYRQGDEGAYLLDEAFSPGAYTNDKGEFQILNIKPGEYVFVIGDPKGTYEVITDNQGTARTWTVPSDQTLDLGTVETLFQVEE